MAPHDHLLDNFSASKETRDLANEIIHLAKLKTSPGSGRELREFTTGLPAVCILLASERLNNGDVSTNSAQIASCLKKKDFKKVYDIVKAAVGEEEEETTYGNLHQKYKSERLESALQPFFTQIENDLIRLVPDIDRNSVMFKTVVYFWVCVAAKLKTVPGTEIFASEQRQPIKKFANHLQLLNEHCMPLRKKIQVTFKPGTRSPTKEPAMPRQSPRKAVNVQQTPSKVTATSSQIYKGDLEQQSPTRRLRSSHLQESPSNTTPTKRPPQPSPSKIVQPTPFRPWQKGPVRELPSKASPKKRAAENIETQADEMDVESPTTESPTKRRKLDSPSKPTTPSASASQSPAPSPIVRFQISGSPTKKAPSVFPPSAPARSSPLKRGHPDEGNIPDETVDAASSSDESETHVNLSTRRFRPVYLDYKQWNARDPRLSRIWRKADKRQKAAPGASESPMITQRRGA